MANATHLLRGLRLHHFLLLLLCLIGHPAAAQIPTWQTALLVGGANSVVTATAADERGNIYVSGTFIGTANFGSTSLTTTGYGVFIAKWSESTRGFVWARQATGTGGPLQITGMTAVGDNVYIAGSFAREARFGNYALAASGYAMFVVKLSESAPNGFVWAQQSTGTGTVDINGISVSGTDVYVVGNFNYSIAFGATTLSSSDIGRNLFITQLTDAGLSSSFTWARQGNDPYGNTATGVASTSSGVYVTGSFNSTLSFGGATVTNTNGDGDLFVVKLGADGTARWIQQSGGPSGTASSSAVVVSGSNVYVTGSCSGSTTFGSTVLPNGGFFVSKLTDAGASADFIWTLPFQLTRGIPYSGIQRLAVHNANIYVAGCFYTATFGTTTMTAAGMGDAYVARFTDLGSSAAFIWARSAGGTNFDYATGLAISPTGTVYLGGQVGLPASFGSQTLSGSGRGGFLATLTEAIGMASTTPILPVALAAYPNPAHTRVHVPAATVTTRLTLLNALGREVRTASGGTLSVQGIASGFYLLRAATPGQPIRTARLVVE